MQASAVLTLRAHACGLNGSEFRRSCSQVEVALCLGFGRCSGMSVFCKSLRQGAFGGEEELYRLVLGNVGKDKEIT